MALKKTILLLLILSGFFISLRPTGEEAAGNGKITAAWCWTEDSSTAAYIQQLDAVRHLDVVSPTGIYLADGSGRLVNKIDDDLVRSAHKKGQQVWALFGNTGFNKEWAHQVLIDQKKSRQVIRDLVRMAVENNYDGVNIDWEGLETGDRDRFTSFVRELSAGLKKENKIVSIDVTLLSSKPSIGPWSNWYFCYDRKALGDAVDYMMLMAYDEHNQSWPNGSVASLPWVEDGIETLLKEVPAEKIILGVPFYTHDFSKEYEKGSQYIGMTEAQKRVRENKGSVIWDDKLGQHVASYMHNGFQHKIWLEDGRSMGLKLDLVEKYGLAGMAAWSLGYESPEIWQVIGDKMKQ